MKSFAYLISAMMAATAVASPAVEVEKRADTWCDAFGSRSVGGKTVYHNNWGKGEATSGSQCTTFNSLKAGSYNWQTSWSWTGGDIHVKSYSNVALENVNRKLSQIKSIPSTWTWRYTGNNMVSDVAYDLWLAPSVGAANKYEIMVWVGRYGGAGPISDTNDKPLATANILGQQWKVYRGPNGDTTVYSFVAPANIGNFNGDLMQFFNYLTAHQGISKDMVVTSLQAGTEPFVGQNCVFKTSAYTISVN